MIANFLPALPLWLDGILMLALCLASAETGRFTYRYFASRSPGPEKREKSESEDHVVGAIFGLLAFIVGLTFSIAIDRLDRRRGLVVEEANAINTAFLSAELFDEPHRSQLQDTLRSYAQVRISPEGLWDEAMHQQILQSRQVRQRLWVVTRAAVYPVRETELGSDFIETINNIINVGVRREFDGTTFIPDRILNVLLLYLFVAAGVLGYLSGDRARRQYLAPGLLFTLFVIAIILIVDLDRPRAGAIQVSQKALEDIVATFDRTLLPAPRD